MISVFILLLINLLCCCSLIVREDTTQSRCWSESYLSIKKQTCYLCSPRHASFHPGQGRRGVWEFPGEHRDPWGGYFNWQLWTHQTQHEQHIRHGHERVCRSAGVASDLWSSRGFGLKPSRDLWGCTSLLLHFIVSYWYDAFCLAPMSSDSNCIKPCRREALFFLT